MLKKFKAFFYGAAAVKLDFAPFIVRFNRRSYQVMKASDENIPDLLQLEKQVYSGQTPWSRFSFKQELRKRRNSLYLVVYDGGRLAAFIGMRFNEKEGHVTNIAVSPAYQNQGIATFLLQWMINRSRLAQLKQVTLEVRADNEVAQHLYHKLGFRDNFICKNYYLDSNTDAISMILFLAAQSV